MHRISEGTPVHVPHEGGTVQGVVVARQDNGDYAVRLPDGTVQTVDGPLLERANPEG